MSTRRVKAGVSLAQIRRTASGRPRCRWCQRECPPRRRSFCSDDCVHEWRLRRDPAYARECVLARDNGICCDCSTDTIAEWHRLKLLERTDPGAYARECRERKIPAKRTSLWDCDHQVEVADGGGECSLSNLVTRCLWCHRKKTGANITKRSQRKR